MWIEIDADGNVTGYHDQIQQPGAVWWPGSIPDGFDLEWHKYMVKDGVLGKKPEYARQDRIDGLLREYQLRATETLVLTYINAVPTARREPEMLELAGLMGWALADTPLYPAWSAAEKYPAGSRVTQDGKMYEKYTAGAWTDGPGTDPKYHPENWREIKE